MARSDETKSARLAKIRQPFQWLAYGACGVVGLWLLVWTPKNVEGFLVCTVLIILLSGLLYILGPEKPAGSYPYRSAAKGAMFLGANYINADDPIAFDVDRGGCKWAGCLYERKSGGFDLFY